MGYKINELTEEQVKELQQKHPQATIKKYQLVQEFPRNPDNPFMVLGYYASFEDARAEGHRWQGREEIQDKIQEAIDEALELGRQYDIDPDEVRQMFKEA